MVQTKRNEEKVVVTKIYFYDSATTEQKIELCDGKQGLCCQDDQMRGNNSMLISKLHVLLNILAPC